MLKAKITSVCLLFFYLIIFSACDPDRQFDAFESIENESWKINQPLIFETEIKDTAVFYNMYINVRNSGDYPYSNLYVFINTIIPGGNNQRDTAECILADNKGKWTGSGLGGTWTNQIPFRNKFKFPVTGIYKFELTHAMRDNPLIGIKDAGIRIEKVSK